MSKITAVDIMEALRKRYPESEYVHVPEAPQDSGRQGRKIDLLVISMWRSRNHERDAVEIKVSMADFRRELKQPEKADWWWQHSHRFWVAVPDALIDKVKAELPSGWGLLAVSDDLVARIKVKPVVNREATELPTQTVVGLLRAAENAGPSALMRARQEGESIGYDRGVKSAKRSNGQHLEESWDEQRRIFEEMTGTSMPALYEEWGTRYADVIKLLLNWSTKGATQLANFDRAIEAARSAHRDLAAVRDSVKDSFGL